MWKDVPASISLGVTFLTVLVALTLIFVSMMASNARVNVPSSAPSENLTELARLRTRTKVDFYLIGFNWITWHDSCALLILADCNASAIINCWMF
jgi:hypothetical protein